MVYVGSYFGIFTIEEFILLLAGDLARASPPVLALEP